MTLPALYHLTDQYRELERMIGSDEPHITHTEQGDPS